MQNLSPINDTKDIITKEYIDNLKGKLTLPPVEKIYNVTPSEAPPTPSETDITSGLTVYGNYYINSSGVPASSAANTCYKCSLSMFTPTKIYGASRSLSWYTYAFYSSSSVFDSTTFISGGHHSQASTGDGAGQVKYETLNISSIPSNAVVMLVVKYSVTDFSVTGYVNNSSSSGGSSSSSSGELTTVSEAVDEWITDGYPRAIVYKHTSPATSIYRVGSGRTPSTTEFTNLIDAVAQWVSDSKPCATIFVDSGVYVTSSDPSGTENALTIMGGENRLTIIGENRDSTIIKSTTGRYVQPPINVQGGNVTIKNMTFIADHSSNMGFTYREKSSYNSAYAVHCDGGSVTGVTTGGVIEFENCNMWSWQSCGLGSGTCENSHLIVKNCDIRSYVPGTATDEGSIAPGATDEQIEAHAIYVHGSRGAIVYHPSSAVNTSNESFELINSRVYLKGGTKTAKITCGNENNGYRMVTFVDNTFWNDIESCNTVPLSEHHHLNTLSNGNNLDNLNSGSNDNYLIVE